MTRTSLHVWSYFGQRSQAWLYRLLFCMESFEPHLLLRRQWETGRNVDEFPWPADRLTYFPARAWPMRLLGKFQSLLRCGRSDVLNSFDARFVRDLCASVNASVLHIHFGWLADKFLGGQADFGVPVVISLYGSDVFRAVGTYKKRLRDLLRSPVYAVVTSHALREAVIEIGADPSRVHVVRVGLPGGRFPNKAQSVAGGMTARGAGRLKLITVGRCIDFKAPHLLPAVARILVDRGIDFEWSLIGDGPLLAECRRNCERLGVQDRFVLRGSLPYDAVEGALRGSDLMVHNAVVAPDGGREALGVTLVEAAALGLPVVSCAVGGIPEVVVDGETGFLVPLGDTVGMAQRIIQLAEDGQLRTRMGRAAAKYVSDSFDSSRLARQIEDIYASLSG